MSRHATPLASLPELVSGHSRAIWRSLHFNDYVTAGTAAHTCVQTMESLESAV